MGWGWQRGKTGQPCSPAVCPMDTFSQVSGDRQSWRRVLPTALGPFAMPSGTLPRQRGARASPDVGDMAKGSRNRLVCSV